jgi:hypothetical protein
MQAIAFDDAAQPILMGKYKALAKYEYLALDEKLRAQLCAPH